MRKEEGGRGRPFFLTMLPTETPIALKEASTAGIRIQTRRAWLGSAVELVSSMRFAISLLTLISIASVIGTVLKQSEPMTNYVNQFGPFWFDVFGKLGLYTVYSAWWFLVIMAFLVLSTSLCIFRNAPKMLADARNWRDNVREQSLRNFHHHVDWKADVPRSVLAHQLAQRIAADGYQAKVVEKEAATLVAAKRGGANKWGYIFAHSAIVVICLGGLLDSDLPIRLQKWFQGKTPFAGDGLIADVPAQHRLSVNNPTFRGNTLVPEGGRTSTIILPQQDGVLIQDLPFQLELKKFTIDFYTTGMPKLFASDVILRDKNTGEVKEATIKVNQPLIHDGIAIYQSSFEDGGSKLDLTGYPMQDSRTASFPVKGEVSGSTPLAGQPGGDYSIEWTGFRPFNIENLAEAGAAAPGADSQDPRAVNIDKTFNRGFMDGLNKQLGSAAKGEKTKDLKNVGPSVQYKLRDSNGQAREFNNYMLPIRIDGAEVFLAGVRETPNEPFRYLRIPADADGTPDDWMRLRAALADPALRAQAAERYARRAIADSRTEAATLQSQLRQSAEKGLDIFIGDGTRAGFLSVSAFLSGIPQAEQEKAADVFMKILNGTLWELWQLSRERAGLPAVESTGEAARFLQLATNALSDAFFYNAPVYLRLESFEEIKASVFQVTRSPGKNIVYLGCLLLTLGIFAMLYIRERRIWVWLKSTSSGTQALMAMSTQRRTLDFDKEFEQWKVRLALPEALPVPVEQPEKRTA